VALLGLLEVVFLGADHASNLLALASGQTAVLTQGVYYQCKFAQHFGLRAQFLGLLLGFLGFLPIFGLLPRFDAFLVFLSEFLILRFGLDLVEHVVECSFDALDIHARIEFEADALLAAEFRHAEEVQFGVADHLWDENSVEFLALVVFSLDFIQFGVFLVKILQCLLGLDFSFFDLLFFFFFSLLELSGRILFLEFFCEEETSD